VEGIAFFKMAPVAGPWPSAGSVAVAPRVAIDPTNVRRVRELMATT
jgi:hypothetical protein